MDIKVFPFIAFGGMAGALARWGVLEVLPEINTWPWQIFIVNMVGCCVLGIIMAEPFQSFAPRTFAGLTTGFCASFTTFSIFSVELAELLRSKEIAIASTYLIASSFGGLLLLLASKVVFSHMRVFK